ncbi:hypothetical protein K9O30_16665 [Clostridium bowmanii]|uniref:hypothetical protein n=1 Tax=Clostridium bowmanii TaxID=132925 RepID=UPI001C0DB8BB|nr:hypothetical protein [Clostridium bowmanii]MBU3191000.1 hypothetical protein [Clostridium bowmanii]MCA1075322.1 hypothetical protein [Clostridium bowmanii]
MQSNISHYSTFICGATATAIGIASENINDTLIVERTGLVANEFIDCYHIGSKNWNSVSHLGKNLKKELIQRNILSEAGMVHIPAVAPVLFKAIKNLGINTLFITEVIEVKKIEEVYEITLHNNSGFQKITADKIIDTTSTIHPKFKQYTYSKSINAMLHSIEENLFPFSNSEIIENENVCFEQGRFDKEIILKYSVSNDEDWIEARHKLHSYWQNRPAFLKKWSLATIASTFDIEREPSPLLQRQKKVLRY